MKTKNLFTSVSHVRYDMADHSWNLYAKKGWHGNDVYDELMRKRDLLSDARRLVYVQPFAKFVNVRFAQI